MTARRNRAAIFTYAALLAFSLPIPLLHHSYTDAVIETMRPMIQLSDGRWAPMLLPVFALLLRWLGQLSWCAPCGILALLILSFRREKLTHWVKRWDTICAAVMTQCAFSTFYAFYAVWLLGHRWLLQ